LKKGLINPNGSLRVFGDYQWVFMGLHIKIRVETGKARGASAQRFIINDGKKTFGVTFNETPAVSPHDDRSDPDGPAGL
jgi:hypothetical protein